MLDIKFIRENPNIVKENIKKKFQDEKLPLVDEVIELDSQRRANIQEADQLRSDPVSYTHLDVYKRQLLLLSPAASITPPIF